MEVMTARLREKKTTARRREADTGAPSGGIVLHDSPFQPIGGKRERLAMMVICNRGA